MGASPFGSIADGSTRFNAAPGATPVGVALAGGASRRMGLDKAMLDVGGASGGESLARRAAERLALVCPEVAVADRGRGLVAGRRSLTDGPGRGPAAGILGAAAAYPGRPLLILACDLPAVPPSLLADLADLVDPADLAVHDLAIPRWNGRAEPLCALYGPAALAVLAERVAHGLFSLYDLATAEGLKARWLEGEELARHGPPEEMFLNLNTPEDLERWRTAGV